jgi:hypothetical protein
MGFVEKVHVQACHALDGALWAFKGVVTWSGQFGAGWQTKVAASNDSSKACISKKQDSIDNIALPGY